MLDCECSGEIHILSDNLFFSFFLDFTKSGKKHIERLLLLQAVFLDLGEWEKIAHTTKFKLSYVSGTLL